MHFAALFLLAAQTGSLEGTVLHSVSNSPIRKATVALSGNQFRLTASTDSEGRYQFTALPPGTYKVVASLPGFADRPAPRPILLGAETKATVPPLRLRPQGILSGRVLDEDGDPIPNARLWLFKQKYREGRKQWVRLEAYPMATETGDFRIPQLAPGAYLLQADDPRAPVSNRYGDRSAQREFATTFYPSSATQQGALPIEVGVGADLRGIEIRLVKTLRPAYFRVTGSITGISPGSEALVRFSGSPGSTVARAPAYTFDIQVTAGEHTILASEPSDIRQAWAMGSVTVDAEVSGIVLAMSPAPKVTGQVTLTDSDSPVSRKGIRVSLNRVPSVESFPPDASDDAGKFDFTLHFGPGRYAIALDPRSLPVGCYVQAIKVDGKDLPTPEVHVLLASIHLDIILSPNAGTITGTVSDFPSAIVTLIPAEPSSPPIKQVAGDDGKFTFTNLRPGLYRLYAWDQVDDDLWPDPDFHKRFASNAVEITVAPRATAKAQLQVTTTDDAK